jgi:hypothetical protein
VRRTWAARLLWDRREAPPAVDTRHGENPGFDALVSSAGGLGQPANSLNADMSEQDKRVQSELVTRNRDHPSSEWRVRSARTLWRLPQCSMEHQRRQPGREVST